VNLGKRPPVHLGLPELLTGRAIETDQPDALRVRIARREEDALADNAGRRVALAGQLDAPQHVLLFAPLQRRILIGRCVIVQRRATPAGPVARGLGKIIQHSGLRLRIRRILPRWVGTPGQQAASDQQ